MVKRLLVAGAVLLATGLAAASALAQPKTLEGELGGAPYRILVPDGWNGTLLVHAHGYRDKADGPGEVDDRSAPAAPSGALEAPLLAMGYALAGSAYRDNGWAVREGIHDTRALTSFFSRKVGRPRTTLLWGFSMGSVVALDLAEHGGYDGVLAGCAVAAGTTRAWDGAAAHLLAYDVAFGMPSSWGTPADVRDDLDFDLEVAPKAFGLDLLDPQWFAKTEFIRLVTQVAGPSGPLPPAWLPGGYGTNLYFLTEARAELERRAHGAPVQNRNHDYSLAPADKAYLAAVGLPPAQADALLAEMNGTRFHGEHRARSYLRRYADFSGRVHQPVLTLHTSVDTLVPPAHESAYRETVEDARRERRLYQAFTTGSGHCAFSGEQLITSIQALESWAETRTAPTAASFPAALGFDNAFVPPAFPFP